MSIVARTALRRSRHDVFLIALILVVWEERIVVVCEELRVGSSDAVMK